MPGRLGLALQPALRAGLGHAAWLMGTLASAWVLAVVLLVVAVVPWDRLAQPWALLVAPALPVAAAALWSGRLRRGPSTSGAEPASRAESPGPGVPQLRSAPPSRRGAAAQGMVAMLVSLWALQWVTRKFCGGAGHPVRSRATAHAPMASLRLALLTDLLRWSAARLGAQLLVRHRAPDPD